MDRTMGGQPKGGRDWRSATTRAALTACLVASAIGPARAQPPPGAPQSADPAAAAPSEPRSITLDEALEMARRHAPGGVQAAGQLRAGRARVRSAWAAFVPSVSLSAGSTRQFAGGDNTRIENGTVVTLPSTPWSYSASIGANVSLFEGGNRLFSLRQARAGVASAEANEVAQRFQVDLDVKQRFFDVLAARESEGVALAQVQQAEQQLKAAVLRLRAARATKSDSLRSDIQLRNAQLAVAQARADLETAEAALARAVGASEPVTATAAGAGDAEPIALDEAALAALAADGPAVRQARAELTSAKAAKASAWTDYLPSLGASYSRGGSGSGGDVTFGADDLRYNGTFRLSLSLPLFNQLGREEQVVQRDVALDNAEAALRDTRLAARESFVRAWGALRTAEQRIEAQTASVAAAEEDLRVQQQRYALGESTLLDLLTSQTQLNDARVALIRARYDQRIARATLEALVGRDL